MIRTLWLVLSLWLALPVTSALADATELTPLEIMTRVKDRDLGVSTVSDGQLVLIDRKERERIRDLRMYFMEDGDVSRVMTFFTSPADIAGTAYLSNFTGRQDAEAWVYLPALKQVRRIVPGERSDSFMGSDFNYYELNLSSNDLDWYEHEMIHENEEVDGHPVWVIEKRPTPEHYDTVTNETGYERSQVWVRKDNFIIVQAKNWMADQERIRYYTARNIRKVNGIWTVFRQQMVTTRFDKREHASVYRILDITYNEFDDLDFFTPEAMRRGAP